MSKDKAERASRAEVDVEDREMLDWLAHHYRPAPLRFEESAAFDRRLRARERPFLAGFAWLPPALVAVGLLALLWLAVSPFRAPLPEAQFARSSDWPVRRGPIEGTRPPDPLGSRSGDQLGEMGGVGWGWTGALLESAEDLNALYADDLRVLPGDYFAIASVLENDV